jgi:PAS domain S-box-containing protein
MLSTFNRRENKQIAVVALLVAVLVLGFLAAFFIYREHRLATGQGQTILDTEFTKLVQKSNSRDVYLTAEESKFLAENGPIKMCVDPDWYPYEKVNESGRYTGIAADLIELIAARANLEMQLVPTADWTDSINTVRLAKADILCFLNQTPERAIWLDFTDAYFADPTVFITREDHDYISDPARLRGEIVVLPAGTSVEERLRQEYPNLKILIVSTEAEAFEMISQREADMTLRSLTMAAYTIKKQGLFNLKIAGQLSDYTNSFRIGVRKDKESLVKILNKAIATISPEEVELIVNRHVAIEVQTRTDYTVATYIVLVLVIIISVILFWVNYLRRFNRKMACRQKELQDLGGKLQLLSEQLRLVIDTVPNLIFARDDEGRFILANQAVADLFGLRAEDIVGKSMNELGLAPDDAAQYLQDDQAVIASGKQLLIPEEPIKLRNGSFGWYQTIKIPYAHPGFSRPAVLGVAVDITRRLEAEEALREREEKFRLLTEFTSDVIWVLNLTQNRFTYISPSVYGLRGVTAEEALVESVEQTMPEASQRLVQQAIARDLEAFLADPATEKHYLYEIQQYCKDGGLIWVEVATQFRYNRDREIEVVGVSRNIEKRKKLEGQLISAKDAADRANAAKSDFLANMSHEIRTPLSAIGGFLELLKQSGLADHQRDYEEKAAIASKMLMIIINDILDFSKIEAGKLELEAVDFVLHSSINNVVVMMAEKAAAKKLSLRYQMADEIPPCLVGDSFRLEQVLLNLLSNAVKFTESGSVVVKTKNLPALKEAHARFEISVTDTGIGMTPEQLQKLFRPFVQADGSTTRRFGGSGLGLVICQSLLGLMESEIQVESHPGQGSRFYFTVELPIGNCDAVNKSRAGFWEADFAAIQTLHGVRVLLAEDNALNQQVAAELMRAVGIEVDVAENGQEVLDKFSSNEAKRYDLLLMDIQMPVLDGFIVTRMLRERGLAELPIIALTANAIHGYREQCIAAGMNDYLSKPIDSKTLYQTIARWTKTASDVVVEYPLPATPLAADNGVSRVVGELQIELALRRLGGDTLLYDEILTDFSEMVPVMQEKLKEMSAGGNKPPALQKLLHDLKGQAGAIGAIALAATSEEAENELRENRDPSPQIELLLKLLHATQIEIAEYVAARK